MPTSRSRTRTRPSLVVLLALLWAVAFVASPAAHAATFVVINNDGAGEGFNDPTPVAPVGGNTGTTLGAQRLIAFQHAADIWGALLSSAVTIRVTATFDPLACNATSAILGSAGPVTAFRDFTGAPVSFTWFPSALANALHGTDLDAAADISAQFNSALGTTCSFPRGWYYGLDGNAGGDIDFVTVLLHELGHGLGFTTFVDLASGAKALGFNDTFMLNLESHGASPADYPSMTNAQRVAASTNTGNLHWVGAHVRAASGVLTAGKVGDHVRMFAPNPQQGGSSVSHWDTALSPDQLLEPSYTVPLDPELELSLFQDIGWTLAPTPTLQVTPGTNIAASGIQGGPFAPSAFPYQLSMTTGSANFSISGVPSWLTASTASGTATTSATTVTFTVNASASSLAPGTYGPTTITFTNTTNGQGNTTRTATLTVSTGPALTNLALNKSATQSSDPGWGPASKAVDGNTDGDWAHNSVTHTGLDAQAWWQVDLGSPQSVQSVEVWNRTDCCGDRLSNFNVLLLDSNQAVIASVHVGGQGGSPTTVQLSGVARYVRVQLVGTNYLSLAEVRVWGSPSALADLALNKPATQSSDPGWGPASRAVDGNTDGDWAHNSVTHTGLDAQAWWQVDLGSPQVVQSVEVWNRTDCCGDRLSNFNVLLLDGNQAVIASAHVGAQGGSPTTVQLSGVARYVKVQLVGTNYLSLAEVRVWGPVTNLALNKPATQSSDPGWGPASRAVDGNTDGNWAHGSVSHTGLDAQAWWQVDLGSPQSVQSVEVWNRTDCCPERLSNFNVLLLDSNHAVIASALVGGQAGSPTTVPLSGTARYVRVQLVGTNYLSLAEVRVWGN